jgi:hypothetical protein
MAYSDDRGRSPTQTRAGQIGRLVSDPKSGTVLGPRLAAIVKSSRRDVGVAEPVLDLGDIGSNWKAVGGSGCPQRVNTEAVHFGADAGLESMFPQDIVVKSKQVERAIELARAIIRHRTKHSAAGVRTVAGESQVLFRSAGAPARGRVRI